MKIHFLGTAAGECVPGMFCDCDICERSRTLGGRNIRTRFQMSIDDVLLIDFGADTYYHVAQYGLPLWKITTCLITHNHTDHLRAEDFELRRQGIAHGVSAPLQVYATAPAAGQIAFVVERFRLAKQNRVLVHSIEPFVTFEADGYVITPLRAAHSPECEPVFYQIEAGGRCILLAHDTGWFPMETWDYLAASGKAYDFISLDCTDGTNEKKGGSHMSFTEAILMRDELRRLKLAREDTQFCLNHFSHNGRAVYDDFAPIAEKAGFITAYDNMIVTLE